MFKNKGRDPSVLESKSKAPINTKNRKRIPKDIEDKILEVRAFSKNIWGKQKIVVVLKRDYKIKISPNTVNKYLHKHKKSD
ncbi:MAG: helix-turn-helix domain-containing protein [Patescibacteria group bacterium]